MPIQQYRQHFESLLRVLLAYAALFPADTISHFRQILNAGLAKIAGQARLRVPVSAQIKCGKSTLLNTLLHRPLLHTTNVPATSSLVFLRYAPPGTPPVLRSLHQSEESSVLTEGEILASGDEHAIAQAVESVNTRLRNKQPAPSALVLYANIPFLDGMDREVLELLEFVDTPGAGEAGNATVEKLLVEVFQSLDLVVLVFDYTAIGTDSEQAMWRRLHQLRPEVIENLATRAILVVNRFDDAQIGALSRQDVRQYVCDRVKQYVGVSPNPTSVTVTNSLWALYARLARNPERLDDVTLGRIAATFAPAFWSETRDEHLVALRSVDVHQYERISGIPELEAKIREEVVTRVVPLLERSVQSDLHCTATCIKDLALRACESNGQSIAQLQHMSQQLAMAEQAAQAYFANDLQPWLTEKLTVVIPGLMETARTKAIDTLQTQKHRLSQTPNPSPFPTHAESVAFVTTHALHFRDELVAHISEPLSEFSRRLIQVFTSIRSEFCHRLCIEFSDRLTAIDPSLRVDTSSIRSADELLASLGAFLQSIVLVSESHLRDQIASFIETKQYTVQEQRVFYERQCVGRRGWGPWRRRVYADVPVLRTVSVTYTHYPVHLEHLVSFLSDVIGHNLFGSFETISVILSDAVQTSRTNLESALRAPLEQATQRVRQALDGLQRDEAARAAVTLSLRAVIAEAEAAAAASAM